MRTNSCPIFKTFFLPFNQGSSPGSEKCCVKLVLCKNREFFQKNMKSKLRKTQEKRDCDVIITNTNFTQLFYLCTTCLLSISIIYFINISRLLVRKIYGNFGHAVIRQSCFYQSKKSFSFKFFFLKKISKKALMDRFKKQRN